MIARNRATPPSHRTRNGPPEPPESLRARNFGQFVVPGRRTARRENDRELGAATSPESDRGGDEEGSRANDGVWSPKADRVITFGTGGHSPDDVAERREARRVRSRRGPLLAAGLRVSLRPLVAAVPPSAYQGREVPWLITAALPLPRGARREGRGYGGVDCELVAGAGVGLESDSGGGPLVLYFHGGGFILGSPATHRRLAARISSAAGAPVLLVDYPLLGVSTLAGMIADCLRVYEALLDAGYPAQRMVFAGDSAGGYLAFAVALAAAQAGLPAPAALVGLSPWLDLRGEHSARHPNVRTEALLSVRGLRAIARELGDPPPIFDADLSAVPPVLLQVSSTELFLPDAERMAGRLRAAGVPCWTQIWERQAHVFQVAADVVPDGWAAIAEIGAFARHWTAQPSSTEDHAGAVGARRGGLSRLLGERRRA